MKETLLAKSSGESLAAHTAWCLKAGKALLASLPLPEQERHQLETDVLLAVAFHDAGKAASGFQRVLRGEQKDWGGRRHEILSAAFASLFPDISPAVLFAILTHHKDIPTEGITGEYRGNRSLPWEQLPWEDDLTPVWQEMIQEWKQNRELFRREWIKICKALGRSDLVSASQDLTALALSRAWMNRSTGKKGQRKSISFSQRYYTSLVRGLTVAADHLGSAHHVPPPIPDLKLFSALRQDPRPFQKRSGNTEGSAILRAPTGSGKTEAALLWAQRNQQSKGRLFYVLPYTASINAMYRRLGPGVSPTRGGIFGANNVGLLHARATAALYNMLESDRDACSRLDRQKNQENAKTLSNLAHEMWFPIRVCTPHQILRYILRGKGWETMLAEFPNACFIFDEVHAYDPRVVGLTLATAKLLSCWRGRSLFLSATLPEFLESLIREAIGQVPTIAPDHSLMEDRKILDRKRHALEIRHGALLENLEDIIRATATARSTLVVCNHVQTAQAVFAALRARFGPDVILLHGRFNQEDRNNIERDLVANSLPKVLVATQVIEVSLDVDFDQAFIEPAPIDALVQRMGRVNRAGIREPASVVIFTEQVNRYRLYCECSRDFHETTCRVRRSIEVLQGIQNPIGEKDLVDAANQVYAEGYRGKDKQAFDEGFNHPDIIDFEGRLLAGAHQDWVEQVIESTDGTVEVLPKCLIEEYETRRRQGLWIEANSLLVSIRTRSLNAIRAKLDTSTDPWIVDSPYSSTKGLDL